MIGDPFKIKENDTRPRYVVPLLENYEVDDNGNITGDAMDLTDVTGIKFLMSEADEEYVPTTPDGTPKVTDSTHAVVTGDPMLGIVTYTWQTGDTDTDGPFAVEYELTYSDGGKETVPNGDYFPVLVIEDLG